MTNIVWDQWGHLRDRYETARPRRMLALDGGGIRGLMSLQVLARVESLLAGHYHAGDAAAQQAFRLCHFFDYIGGTSTGAIIAAGLARGMSVAEVEAFYSQFGQEAFAKRSIFARWKSLYENGPLAAKLQHAFSANGALDTLEPRYLKTLLLVVSKNLTTDSAWPISSNPGAKYNDAKRPDCNLKIPLWQIVRASTAAPVYFPPEVVHLDKNDPEKSFVFVDGGTTPYNFPGFLMVRMATSPAYKLGWPMGEDKLLLVSVGTGWAPVEGTQADDPETNIAAAGLTTLKALMRQAEIDQDLNCRIIGRCSYGHVLDREVGDLIPRRDDGTDIPLTENLGRGFLYCRYDAELSHAGLADLKLSGIDPKAVGSMDDVEAMPQLTKIGQKLAERVDLGRHFGSFLDVPLARVS
jgi:predicted acylesterase/phospholipase RssA